ncbi:MATE family efflux transporter [Thermospira aquatica]|uniref:Polysaccharide biosynthesis protein n=1 Tax=Thermospira aquatica TaxID=2828656 RepID=A0AAX3BCW1_9SPIR|nr:hypothetical protein [Thermospira aquatica]URA09918.1 hypothetical protein KDW03_10600 [Thermospira aquatica]
MGKRSFFWNTSLSLMGFGLLTLTNFLYSIVTVRLLSPREFSAYNTFFYFLLSLPLPSFQLAVAKSVSRYSPSVDLKSLFSSFVVLSGLSGIAYLIFSPLLWYLYGKNYPFLVVIGFFVLQGWIWLSGLRGIFQGSLRFGTYSLNMALEGIFRLLLGSLGLIVGLGVYGALGASIASGMIGILFLVFPLFFSGTSFKPSQCDTSLLSSFFRAFFILLPFGLLVVLDQTIINRFIPSYGQIVNLSSLFGKNLIALSLTVAHVVFAYVVKEGEDRFLLRGMGLVVALFFLAYGGTFFLGHWLFQLLFATTTGADFLPLYILYCLPLGILQLLVNYGIAEEQYWLTPFLWIMLVLTAFSMMIFARLNAFSLIGFYLLGMILHTLFLIPLIIILLVRKKNSQASEKKL